MYNEEICRISKNTNGYTVEVCDPELKKRNKNPKAPYKSPWKSYVFKDIKQVNTFLSKTIATLTPPEDDFSTSFDKACTEIHD